MKLLITGASGFVGRVFLNHLSRSKSRKQIAKLYLVENNTAIPKPTIDSLLQKTDIHLVRQDLAEPWRLPQNVDVVLNLAADGSQNPYSSTSTERFLQINRNFLKWSTQCSLRRVIHISSGICDYLDVKPNSTILFSSEKHGFALGRKSVEERVQNFFDAEKVPNRILRLYSFIGSELLSRPYYAINQFMMMAQTTGVICVKGNSESKRTYLSERDLGSVLDHAVFAEDFPNHVSVGAQDPVTMKQLATLIAEEFQSEVKFLGEKRAIEDYTPEYAMQVLPGKENLLEPWNDTLRLVAELVKKGAHEG